MLRLDGSRLIPHLARTLERAGVDRESASHVAASVVETSLRGVDSHGIHLFPHYHRAALAGRVNPRPRMRFERRRPATAVLNADHAFGHHAGSVATALAIELASASGMGLVAVRNSTHFGAAAYFALQASRLGFIAMAFTNADSLVRAANARQPFLGTNPICFTAPMAGEEPFCLDMATSRVSWNRVLNHRLEDVPLAADWASNARGEPTLDPAEAAMLEPIGDYKGYGLALMVEVLCGLLSDGPAADELLPMYTAPLSSRRRISHCFAAIDIASFSDSKRFARRLTEIAGRLRALPPRSDRAAVMVPGDPEKAAVRARTQLGIPIEESRFAELLAADQALQEVVLP